MPAAKRILKKMPAILIVMIILCALAIIAGANEFLTGMVYAFIIWLAIKLHTVFVVNCLWYANSKKARIPGTEDMESVYKDYPFYMSSIGRSLLTGLLVSVLVGFAVSIIVIRK